MKRYLLFIYLIISSAVVSGQYTSVSYYMIAHPDDWQLFMGVNAFNDITSGKTDSGNKVVLIYTTAGEQNCYGLGVDSNYYLARQTGANRSVQFCADTYSPHDTLRSSVITVHGINDHNILRYQYKNVISYFMRLPDGCLKDVHADLENLHDGTIASLTTVDGTATYVGYEDLIQTVEQIMVTENGAAPQVWINAQDWDPSANPGDHRDHMQTGLLAATVSTRISCSNLALFEGYHTSNEPENLNPDEIAMEAGLHCQSSYALTHAGYGTEWDPGQGHVEWTLRNYFRVFNTCGTTQVKENLKKFVTNSSPGGCYLNVYPNPAQSVINMTYIVMEHQEVTIGLFSADGRSLGNIIDEQKERGVYTASYNVDMLPPGLYFVHVKMGQYFTGLQFSKR